VVDQAKQAGMTDEQTLGTVLVTLAGSTFLVGLLIVLVGECRNERLQQ
jgi:ABC-type proline/glycine betaine transport system permease subunit